MKLTPLTILLLAGCVAAWSEGRNTDAKEKTAILFDRDLYVLQVVDQNKVVRLNEYYLRNEGPQNWTKLLSVAIYLTKSLPGDMARSMEADLSTRQFRRSQLFRGLL